MAKWVIGYNQMLGDLYTIVDMNNIIKQFLGGDNLEQIKAIENDEYILYLRDNSITSLALVSKALKMQDAQEFKEHIWVLNMETIYNLEKGRDYNWNLFKKENMSENEWNLLQAIKSLEKIKFRSKEEKEEFLVKETTEENKYQKLALALVEKVYLDDIGKPIFSISVQKMVKYLLKLNAY